MVEQIAARTRTADLTRNTWVALLEMAARRLDACLPKEVVFWLG